jgi:hypothetical protein
MHFGEALGKVIGYSLSLDGSDGRIKCEVRIGCAIGRGGSAVAAGGDPTYCDIAYAGADYQQFTGRTVLFDTSVGYQPPAADPNDDGLNFLSSMTAEDVIDIPLVVENPPSVQMDYVWTHAHWVSPSPIIELYDTGMAIGGGDSDDLFFINDEQRQAAVQARAQSVNTALSEVPTKATFKLKGMSRQFSSDYDVQVTDLKVPTGYDLEAV